MNKKILVILMAAVVLAGISAVSAVDADFHEDVGLSYNAPEGYDFDGCYDVIGVMDIQAKDEGASFKYTSDKGNVSVTAFAAKSSSNDDLKDALNPGVVKKTIEKKDGFIDEMGDTVTFYYLEDGMFIYITAPDESVIEQMLEE